MKNFYFLVGALLTSFSTLSQNVVEVNASDNWVGYSFSWMSCLYARVGNAEMAKQYLDSFVKAFIY